MRMSRSAIEGLDGLVPLFKGDLAEFAGVPEARRVIHVFRMTRDRFGKLGCLDDDEPLVGAALLEDRAGQPGPGPAVQMAGSARWEPYEYRGFVGKGIVELIVHGGLLSRPGEPRGASCGSQHPPALADLLGLRATAPDECADERHPAWLPF